MTTGKFQLANRPQSLGSQLSIPEKLTHAWEAAYRQYGTTSTFVACTPEEVTAARQMATASREVARRWRDIAARQTLPWWTLAALESAAEAFEAQARDWDLRISRFDVGGL